MELANNALLIAREGIQFRNIQVDGLEISTKCQHSYQKLSDCVVKNKLNILNHDGTFPLIQKPEAPATSTSGRQNAQEQSAAVTSKKYTEET